jgi:hypothetical protein
VGSRSAAAFRRQNQFRLNLLFPAIDTRVVPTQKGYGMDRNHINLATGGLLCGNKERSLKPSQRTTEMLAAQRAKQVAGSTRASWRA